MAPISDTEFRDTFSMFRQAPDALIRDFLSVAQRQSFPEGMLVYAEGDRCPGIAFLLSGEIRVFKMGDSGREITLYEISRGETCILNASCILSSTNYPAHAVATEGGEMLLIPAAEFRRFISAYDLMRDFVFAILSMRLTAVMELVEEVAFGRMDRRLMEYLVQRSEGGELHATHQKIADDLGTSREVVSRLLKDFEKKGKIALSRTNIRILPE